MKRIRNMRKKNRGQRIAAVILACCLLGTGLLSACGKNSVGSRAGEKKQEEVQQKDSFKIVTSFYPLYIMMMNLTEGIPGVEIANMAEPGTGCLHDYQLRPGDLVEMDGADLFVANGGGMENFLADVMAAYPDLPVVYALDGADPDALIRGEGHEHAHGHTHETGEDEAAQTEESLPEEAETETEEVNPHTWLDGELYQEELGYLAEQLGNLDGGHREQYIANAKEYAAQIDRLLEEGEAARENGRKPGCVLLHESFVYLAEDWGYPVLATVDVEKDSGFSAKEIRTLVDEVEKAGECIIISDSQYSGRIAGLLSEETGMKTIKLDACVSGEYHKDAWLNSMRKNLEELNNAAD